MSDHKVVQHFKREDSTTHKCCHQAFVHVPYKPFNNLTHVSYVDSSSSRVVTPIISSSEERGLNPDPIPPPLLGSDFSSFRSFKVTGSVDKSGVDGSSKVSNVIDKDTHRVFGANASNPYRRIDPHTFQVNPHHRVEYPAAHCDIPISSDSPPSEHPPNLSELTWRNHLKSSATFGERKRRNSIQFVTGLFYNAVAECSQYGKDAENRHASSEDLDLFEVRIGSSDDDDDDDEKEDDSSIEEKNQVSKEVKFASWPKQGYRRRSSAPPTVPVDFCISLVRCMCCPSNSGLCEVGSDTRSSKRRFTSLDEGLLRNYQKIITTPEKKIDLLLSPPFSCSEKRIEPEFWRERKSAELGGKGLDNAVKELHSLQVVLFSCIPSTPTS